MPTAQGGDVAVSRDDLIRILDALIRRSTGDHYLDLEAQEAFERAASLVEFDHRRIFARTESVAKADGQLGTLIRCAADFVLRDKLGLGETQDRPSNEDPRDTSARDW